MDNRQKYEELDKAKQEITNPFEIIQNVYAQRKKLPQSMKFYVNLLVKKQNMKNMDELKKSGPQFYKDYFRKL